MAPPEDVPEKVIKTQQLQLLRAEDLRVMRFSDLLESARREIQDIIASGGDNEFERARLPGLLRQMDIIRDDLRRQIATEPPAQEPIGALAKRHSEQSFGILAPASPAINIQFAYLDRDLLARFAAAARGNIAFKAQSQIDAIQSAILSKIGIRGLNPTAVARQLAGKEGMFRGLFPVVETILRTETSTVYNAHTAAAIAEANQDHGLGFNKRIHETLDSVRNHPISPAINGMVQTYDRNFAVSVAAVNASAARIGRKSTSGIFWLRRGSWYVGANLPAHYNERGTVTPTKRPPNVDPAALRVV